MTYKYILILWTSLVLNTTLFAQDDLLLHFSFDKTLEDQSDFEHPIDYCCIPLVASNDNVDSSAADFSIYPDSYLTTEPIQTNEHFAISFWLKRNQDDSDSRLMTFYQSKNPEEEFSTIDINEDNRLVIYDGLGDWGKLESNSTISLEEWTHIQITSTTDYYTTNTSPVHKIYINGQLDIDWDEASLCPMNPSCFNSDYGQPFWDSSLPDSLVLGAQHREVYYEDELRTSFLGLLDEVKIYDRLTTDQQALADYQEAVSGKEKEVNNDTCTVIVYDTIQVINNITVYDTVQVNEYVTVTDTLIIDRLISSTNDLIVTNISIYPNPADNKITVDFGEEISHIDTYRFQIISTTGDIITEESISTTNLEIPLSDFESGLYYVRIYGDANEIVVEKKLIITN